MNTNEVAAKVVEITVKKNHSVEFFASKQAQEVILKAKNKLIEFSSLGGQFAVGGDVPYMRLSRSEAKGLLQGLIGKSQLKRFLG